MNVRYNLIVERDFLVLNFTRVGQLFRFHFGIGKFKENAGKIALNY